MYLGIEIIEMDDLHSKAITSTEPKSWLLIGTFKLHRAIVLQISKFFKIHLQISIGKLVVNGIIHAHNIETNLVVIVNLHPWFPPWSSRRLPGALSNSVGHCTDGVGSQCQDQIGLVMQTLHTKIRIHLNVSQLYVTTFDINSRIWSKNWGKFWTTDFFKVCVPECSLHCVFRATLKYFSTLGFMIFSFFSKIRCPCAWHT